MQREKQPEASKQEMEKIKDELEDLLIAYTAEIKEGNERLLKQLEENKQLNQVTERRTAPEIKNVEEPVKVKGNHYAPHNIHVKQNDFEEEPEERYDEYSPPVVNQATEDMYYEQSDTAKVLALAKQGLSVEQIAKKLNMGKGEVDLMLKFYR